MNFQIIRIRRIVFGVFSFLLTYLGVIIFLFLVALIFKLGLGVNNYLKQAGLDSIKLTSFFQDPQENLDSTGNRTNFLILGMRGEGGDSPDLTDTMMIVSYSYTNKNLSTISIPRDLWVISLKTKINSVYHYGQFKDKNGGGIKLVQSAILETLGIPIHYTAVVDFSLFKEAIDLVGGVDVIVERAFTDDQFPIEGMENAFPISSRYESITFEKGLTHMDGATALKFVRSRKAEGEEGNDIARDRRQQLIIGALKQKVLSPSLLFDRQKTISLYKLIEGKMDTNLRQDLYPSVARIGLDSYKHQINQIILSYEPDKDGVSILENPPVSRIYQNQWVLVAKDNNWPALQQYIKNKL